MTWGAAGGGMFTILMIDVGRRFRDLSAGLLAATGGAYWAGTLVGSGAGGIATDLSPDFGLTAVLAGLSAVMLVTFAIDARRRRRHADTCAGTPASAVRI
jgi:predicted MFS family arabinose efflux permease